MNSEKYPKTAFPVVFPSSFGSKLISFVPSAGLLSSPTRELHKFTTDVLNDNQKFQIAQILPFQE